MGINVYLCDFSELEEFQQRLQRCMLTCQDKAKDLMSNKNQQQAEVEKQFADCMCECSAEHLKLIPLMKMRLEAAMPQVWALHFGCIAA